MKRDRRVLRVDVERPGRRPQSGAAGGHQRRPRDAPVVEETADCVVRSTSITLPFGTCVAAADRGERGVHRSLRRTTIWSATLCRCAAVPPAWSCADQRCGLAREPAAPRRLCVVASCTRAFECPQLAADVAVEADQRVELIERGRHRLDRRDRRRSASCSLAESVVISAETAPVARFSPCATETACSAAGEQRRDTTVRRRRRRRPHRPARRGARPRRRRSTCSTS